MMRREKATVGFEEDHDRLTAFIMRLCDEGATYYMEVLTRVAIKAGFAAVLRLSGATLITTIGSRYELSPDRTSSLTAHYTLGLSSHL